MAVRVTQEVLEVIAYPDTAAVRCTQEVIEVVINGFEPENPFVIGGAGAITGQATMAGMGTVG